jgi:c-di-GMP-binding flagellar brake protein YcgR
MIAATLPSLDADRTATLIDECYAQRHPLQIALCLRSLLSRGDFLTVEFEGGQIVTQVLDVDSRSARFVFDLGCSDSSNAALARADALTLRSQPSGIQTEFTTGPAVKVLFDGRPAFEAPMPTLLYYVQRRQYYRVETPLVNPFVAHGRDEAGNVFHFDVKNLSLGGVALRVSDDRFETAERGGVWRGVTLRMGPFGEVSVDLEIAAPRYELMQTGERRAILGCRFIDLSGCAERALQRTITQLELKHLGRGV